MQTLPSPTYDSSPYPKGVQRKRAFLSPIIIRAKNSCLCLPGLHGDNMTMFLQPKKLHSDLKKSGSYSVLEPNYKMCSLEGENLFDSDFIASFSSKSLNNLFHT